MYLSSNTHVVGRIGKIQYMSNIGKHIADARRARGWSQGDLAMKARVSQGTIGHLESGRNESSKKLPQIAAALGMTVEALLKGDVAGSGFAGLKPAAIGHRQIPLISSVQAGQMTEALEPFPTGSAFEYLLTDLPLSEYAFALEIEGQSMEPDFKEGDRIIVDPALQPQPGDFVVAKNGREEATFKKYRPRGIGQGGREVFELVPLNDDYPTINSEHEPARIIGVMVEHRRYRRR